MSSGLGHQHTQAALSRGAGASGMAQSQEIQRQVPRVLPSPRGRRRRRPSAQDTFITPASLQSQDRTEMTFVSSAAAHCPWQLQAVY